ncbi:MAG: hypothetical protein GDA55_02965 [Cellvibrionales bacterium]|nr:hypothetical protein [Cellvibrionales bacterium]
MFKLNAYFTATAVAFLVSLPGFAAAQGDALDSGMLEELVVTGTSRARSAFDSPLTVTQFGEEELEALSSNSQADILRFVPGLKAEGGGGKLPPISL